MRQTWAILFDAYRELNAKKLFWITLALSGLVVVAFAMVSLTPKGPRDRPGSYYIPRPDASPKHRWQRELLLT